MLQRSGTAILLLALTLYSAEAADWPAYRGNAQRSAAVPQSISPALQLAWTRPSPHPPAPAWPPPARRSYWQRLEHIEQRNTDDFAFHPVLAGDLLLYGSSADDQVRCLDARDGQRKWSFYADGPVRYAPTLHQGRAWFGSDDGNVYCLDAATGQLLWRHRVAPADYRLPGNGRIISAWPVRGGIVTDGETVYAVAGLFPQQKVIAAAMNALDGTIVWSRELEVSAQGYLLLSTDLLYVPTGRSDPVALSRKTGEPIRTFRGVGGTFALITEEELIAGPGNDGTLASSDKRSGERLVHFLGRHMAVTPRHSFLLTSDRLSALDRVQHLRLTRESKQTSARLHRLRQDQQQRPNDEALNREIAGLADQLTRVGESLRDCQVWSVPCPQNQSLVACANLLVAGGHDEVAAYDAITGSQVWSAPVDGDALGLALAGNRLVVSTSKGTLHCFSASASPPENDADSARVSGRRPPAVSDTPSPAVTAIMQQLRTTLATDQGYCLIAGVRDGQMAREIARQTRLKVVIIDPSEARVRETRAALADAGVYGRASVHRIESSQLPFTDYFANVILSESGLLDESPLPWSREALHRLLRPAGGLLWLRTNTPPLVRDPLPGAGRWSHQFGNPSNNGNSGDQHFEQPLVLQWFGGPGPQRMVDRHLRAPAPLSDQGRLLVPGENSLIAVDAYNGTELWQIDLPHSQRYSMPYDAGYLSVESNTVCVAVRDHCWIIDAASGAKRGSLPVPVSESDEAAHWGYTALQNGRLFGSAQNPQASRTDAGYDRINLDYNNNQPIVTSKALFRVSLRDQKTAWTYRRGAIANPTITLTPDRVVFVESRSRQVVDHSSGRVALNEFMDDVHLVCLDADTGDLLWERPLEPPLNQSRNVLYCLHHLDRVVVVGSARDDRNDTLYHVAAFDAHDGAPLWSARHNKQSPGAFSHGEQVHHPVALDHLLVTEPVIYDLRTGAQVSAADSAEPWRLQRPGHSCGTITGAGQCLFFRANNPAVLDVTASIQSNRPATKLAPSRPGCWINIIPAAGLVLIPEASAGCVCSYSIQSSMAFRPGRIPYSP